MRKFSIIFKMTVLITLFVLLFGANSASLAATKIKSRVISYTVIKGDIDRDGKITSADAKKVLRNSAKQEFLSMEQQYLVDLKKDKSITAEDARLILQTANKQIQPKKIKISYMPGNVNHNGEVDMEDATKVLRYSAKLENLTSGERVAADVNGDGEITAADARLIMRRVNGVIKAFPIEGDINYDGKIDQTDANLVLRYSAKLEKLTDAQSFMADVNRDGKVTASDARTILRRAQGLE